MRKKKKGEEKRTQRNAPLRFLGEAIIPQTLFSRNAKNMEGMGDASTKEGSVSSKTEA